MIDLFRARGRSPRLEFFAELWPNLTETLAKHGFSQEHQAKAMALNVPPPGRTPTIPIVFGSTDDIDSARQFVSCQACVFDQSGGKPSSEEALHLLDQVAVGSMLYAYALLDQTMVGGAMISRFQDSGELVGVWTAIPFRGRGLAEATCRSLSRRFFAENGRFLWLSAQDDATRRLYQRLGFVEIGTQVNMVLQQ